MCHGKDQQGDERAILKQIWEKKVVRMYNGVNWLRTQTNTGFCY
jgi:hypothetical protein